MMNLAHQMKHMPSLPALASALCHIATIAVVMRGRTDMGTAGMAGAHRNLESTEPPHDLLVTDPIDQAIARLQKAADTHAARLTAVETGTAELMEILKEHKEVFIGSL